MKSEGTPLNTFYNQRKRLKLEKEIPDSMSVLETEEMNVPSETLPHFDKSSDVGPNPNKRKSDKKNKSRKEKKFKKSKKTNYKNKTQQLSESFNLSQTLDISSDESN